MEEEKKTTLEELSYNGTQVVRRGESTIPAFEKTCLKCGTKFIYISEAIKHDRDGDYVVCPCCGAFIAHQERPKTADFIPPKCEDRSPKHSDSFTSLEEAAEAGARQFYVAGGYSPFPNIEFGAYKNGFIAGAEWQKEQLMKEAVEGVVYRYESYQRIATAIIVDIPREELGNKVKIIIVKED